MTTRTKEPIVCECGHEGYLRCSENDQPFSSLWECYSLDGFSGGSLTITSSKEMPEDLLAALKPTCPKCGKTGSVKYA
ncbi:hypothetical protein amb4512 [Paramagnetospirillum magneticum AMB-1]|uniref:Uncharacterized protein n=1 Tax=Paramagnetospirillum magneticum (strain ATCC 700264 / AMB-1) TaxID=342108 RepID=Q2VYK9_PARM1|nr:hypothetical protein amb4512 [Paramagnetospirillum magneticum AMB-1]